ncbi:prephenate dehydrogenase [Sediminivirga luteola]|uniref:Prephenate dehydrogenase n=1 Tax=Sediminivirga luteola TaxID=1774748 RepID=A0A8J2XM94_9MICO|nr:prephenate dehydrogenase [Sediminivirga luteola]MCI2265383.1 prephenate dehydrogenase [Sediminivirga luteola]GGA24391.1 prephenate dehydrogenase [Sediminivirga luteola]
MNTVKIVGTGLLGTSIGLRLRTRGVRVLLADASPTMAALARDMGAGEPDDGSACDLIVVAVPPDVAGQVIAAELRRDPGATVTDVASIKGLLLQQVRGLATKAELDRYIGSHPMAGREKSGAVAARHDLFIGRPWVVCSDEDTPPGRLRQVLALIETMGATPVHLEPDFHDAAVARVSHAPQVIASLMAAQLVDAPPEGVGLAGQGLRDVTRIAASEPGLWARILSGNAAEVRRVLLGVRDGLDRVIDALDTGEGAGADAGAGVDAGAGSRTLKPGAVAELAGVIAAGNEGYDRIPGKHGQAQRRFEPVTVLVDDSPGSLGRLFAAIGEIGVNIEDVRIEHAAGQPLGIVEVFVEPRVAHELAEALRRRGWRVPVERLTEENT